MDEQPTIPGLEPPLPTDGALVLEVMATIEALQEAGALQPWHRGLTAAVIHAARDAEQLRGIARTNQLAQVKDILKSLPEPSVRESNDVVEYEGDRIARFLDEYRPATDPADVPDQAQRASV
ncbi:MAG: hypothetical protein FWF90_16290 [Promicromonosporaceae bacterium]|nr:hypothetical protein [Promicromonosporaceae bacterium]